MPGTAERDLASVELWQESLVRSQRRRVLAADARKDQARKKTASVAVSAAVAASPMWPSVTATAADLSKDDVGKLARTLKHNHAERILLEYGDDSTAVAELQRELGIADDGMFGPQTRAAVKAFQKRHGLEPTGKVDVKTWLKLFPTDMIVYAPPGSTSALGVNNTDHSEWAAVSTAAAAHDSAAAKLGHAAAARLAAQGKAGSSHDPGLPSVHAASLGATGPAVGIAPNGSAPGGSVPSLPGLHGGILAPNGGGGGGGGGPFHFPSLGSFGSAKEMLSAMIRMANRIDSHHYAYRWGGGHNSSFSGPYDCSGAVSAVLHAAGLLKAPMVSGGFMHWGAPGRGAVTIYANAGHVYMSILGRYFGTTSMNPGGGAGWFPGAPRSGFAVVHVPFSKLHFKSHKKSRSHKKHRRSKRKRKATTQQTGPLNQPSTTPAPNSGGSAAPPPSSTPTTTAASNQSSASSQPAQSTPAPSQGPTTPNGQPAPVAQQPAAPAAPAPAPAPTPAATPPAAPPVVGNGGGPVGAQTPNAVPTPQAPAAPAPKVPAATGQGQGTSTPQAPKPPVAQAPNQPQQSQPQQPAQTPSAVPNAVHHAGQQAGQVASTAPPKPPAGGGQGHGSAPNSGE